MPAEKKAMSLSKVVASVLQSLMKAKQLGDIQAVKLAEEYKKEPGLTKLSVPAFRIDEVELELRFAIEELPEKGEDKGNIKVNLSTEVLKNLQENQISGMKVNIKSVDMKVFEEPLETRKP